ncbi:hypothetical protein STEG23_014151, partial [Scotinomys teguina]
YYILIKQIPFLLILTVALNLSVLLLNVSSNDCRQNVKQMYNQYSPLIGAPGSVFYVTPIQKHPCLFMK